MTRGNLEFVCSIKSCKKVKQLKKNRKKHFKIKMKPIWNIINLLVKVMSFWKMINIWKFTVLKISWRVLGVNHKESSQGHNFGMLEDSRCFKALIRGRFPHKKLFLRNRFCSDFSCQNDMFYKNRFLIKKWRDQDSSQKSGVRLLILQLN